MITIRMNLLIPATKPRASSSAANRPTWVAAKVMTINGKASRAAAPLKAWACRCGRTSVVTAPTAWETQIGPLVISRCQDGGYHAEGIAVCTFAQRGPSAAHLLYVGRQHWPSGLSTGCAAALAVPTGAEFLMLTALSPSITNNAVGP